jgi:hypothetical protein
MSAIASGQQQNVQVPQNWNPVVASQVILQIEKQMEPFV